MLFLSVAVLDCSYLVFVPLGVHSRQSLERLINALTLKRAHLEELQAKFVGECLTILRADDNSVLQIDFVGDQDTGEVALILLSDAFVPLLEEMECVLVGGVVDEDDHVCLSQQFKCYFLEDVLTSNINTVQLDAFVRVFLVQLDVLDVVLAALSHNILMLERLVHSLVDEASFANCRLAGHYHSRSQNRHFE